VFDAWLAKGKETLLEVTKREKADVQQEL